MSVIGNAVLPGGGSASLPTVVTDNTTTTATTNVEKSYTVSGNGALIAFCGSISDSTSSSGFMEAKVYLNDVLIMYESSVISSSGSARALGPSTSAPAIVTNGDVVKLTLRTTISGTKTIYRRFLCFGCTVTYS